MAPRSRGARALLCPSAQPDIPGAVAFGLVDHEAEPPEVRYLERPVAADAELLAMAEPLRPTEVFRFAAECQTTACSHWSGTACQLVDRVVSLIPARSLVLPTCRVRADCRWYAQRARAACVACPAIVTQDEDPTDETRRAAEPT